MQLPKRPMHKDKVAIDRDLIHELAALLEETGLDEIEIEQNGMRVRVARHSPVMHLSTGSDPAAPPAVAPAPPPAPAAPPCRRPHPPPRTRRSGQAPRRGDLADGRNRLPSRGTRDQAVRR